MANRVSPQVKFVSCLSANLLSFLVFCPHRLASCSLIQTCVPIFPNLSAVFFACTRFLRQRRRAATIHNMISTPRTPTPPPLPVNAGGRPSTGTRGGGGYIGCRRRPSSYARPPTQEEGGGKPHVSRHRRPSNVIISL